MFSVPQRLKGYFLIFGAALLWGLLGPCSKYLFAAGISPLEAGFFRALFAWLFFGAHAAAKKRVAIDKKDLPLLMGFGFVGTALFYASNMIAVDQGGAALASVLLYTAPFWVALFSYLLFGEKLTPTKAMAMALAVTGVAGICTSGNPVGGNAMGTAAFWGLASGICYSSYYIIGRLFSGAYAPYTLFFWSMPTGILGLLTFVSFTEKTASSWALLLLLALFSYGANSFYYVGLRYLSPTRAVLTATLEPVVSTFFAWLFWKESLGLMGYAGSVLVLAGVLVTILEPAKNKRASQEARASS